MNTSKKNPALRGLKVRRNAATVFLASITSPAFARQGLVTYSVLSDIATNFADRRIEARRRTHLQSGKVLSDRDQFLVECLFRNRTRSGVRLKLARCVGIPKEIQLYDDREGILIAARVVWQRGAEVGCKIAAAPMAAKERLARRLKATYYAVQ